ncbi:MAG: hypothetical protein GFH27_549305n26 [Chloroflexi bacterium AL-W]|nr:hypothetical protein [Chloroflexi bacterium AL-N1]NOK69272.1 hypothetical protein [Chloroflexi bacterium AL-N10]NOK76333.1 hypothetical protein [Chloroflexi bacterium AL-N5]NOK83450.1 hypothetical protein [Chloroflexi bacterium AL-W]NOK91110.1 hypothetical protein [Chloroflexi bacterium AL-N15]
MIIWQGLGDTQNVATSVGNLATVLRTQGKISQAAIFYEQAAYLNQIVGSKPNMARSLYGLGTVKLHQGNFEVAITYYKRGLTLSEELGDKNIILNALNGMGRAYLFLNSLNQAFLFTKRGLDIAREIDNKDSIINMLINLAHVTLAQKKYYKAGLLFKESLTTLRNFSMMRLIPECLEGFAIFFIMQQHLTDAIHLWSHAQKLRKTCRVPVLPTDNWLCEKHVTETRTHLDEDTWQQAWETGQKMSLEEAIDYALEHVLVDERIVGEEARQETDY